jgi:hypothetical protein
VTAVENVFPENTFVIKRNFDGNVVSVIDGTLRPVTSRTRKRGAQFVQEKTLGIIAPNAKGGKALGSEWLLLATFAKVSGDLYLYLRVSISQLFLAV